MEASVALLKCLYKPILVVIFLTARNVEEMLSSKNIGKTGLLHLPLCFSYVHKISVTVMYEKVHVNRHHGIIIIELFHAMMLRSTCDNGITYGLIW